MDIAGQRRQKGNVTDLRFAIQRSLVDVRHTPALRDIEVKCFGENAYGQLGQGSTQDLGDHPNEMGDKLKPIELGF